LHYSKENQQKGLYLHNQITIFMNRKKITLSDEFRTACPVFKGCALYAKVEDTPHNDALWEEIAVATDWLRREFTPDSVKLRSGIHSTREAYKACGKDPSRYRPSNEQLCRRLLQGKELYEVSTVVDLLNLASIRFGYSIGGFDMDKVSGDDIVLGIGREGEDYEGIGRGRLNIAGMPVYRDSIGGIGTPTSDHERTKMSAETKNLMCFINGYDGNEDALLSCAYYISGLLKRYAGTGEKEILIEGF
jgi:DNA/RNA-binding domain of Phe-tRNA-synthetase-like protein